MRQEPYRVEAAARRKVTREQRQRSRSTDRRHVGEDCVTGSLGLRIAVRLICLHCRGALPGRMSAASSASAPLLRE